MNRYAQFLTRLQGQSGFVYRPSSQDIYDAEDRGWQLRIAVFPTQANLAAAAQCLGQLCCQEDLEFKCLVLNDPNQITIDKLEWDGTQSGLDRDQRGKEICIYLRYDSQRQCYERTPGQWKHLLLSSWKLLQETDVAVGYITPPQGDKAVATEAGITTPFSYTANKPWQVRHGLLHSVDYNPHAYADPLVGIMISKADLLAYGIRLTAMQQMQTQRINYQIDHVQQAEAKLQQALAQLIKVKPLTDLFQTLSTLLNQADTQSLLALLNDQASLLAELRARCPRQARSSLVELASFQAFSAVWQQCLKGEITESAIIELRRQLQLLQQEATAEIQATLNDWQVNAWPVANLATLINEHALPMQMLYRRIVHLEHEKVALANELHYPIYTQPANPLLPALGETPMLSQAYVLQQLQGHHLFEQLQFLNEAFQTILENKNGIYQVQKGWRMSNLSARQLADIALLGEAYVACLQREPYAKTHVPFNLTLAELTQASPLLDFNRSQFPFFIKQPSALRKRVDKLVAGIGRSLLTSEAESQPMLKFI